MIITGLSTGFPAAATAVSGMPLPEYFPFSPADLVFSSTSTSHRRDFNHRMRLAAALVGACSAARLSGGWACDTALLPPFKQIKGI